MQELIQAIYGSAATPEITEHDTVKFLNEARKTNRQHDISGMMLYSGGVFLVMLEGEDAKVEAASAAIFAGKKARLISREPVPEREFPEWVMGFETVEPHEAGRLLGRPGMFASLAGVDHIDAESAKTLLSLIGRRRWQSDRSGMFRAIRRTTKPMA